MVFTSMLSPVPPDAGIPVGLATAVSESLTSWILDPRFSCVGAKAAFRRGSGSVGVYGPMGSPEATAGLAQDLARFAEHPSAEDQFVTFAAAFLGPAPEDEHAFETLLWRQLQNLHDRRGSPPEDASATSDDPEDPHFAFSFAGRSFFVVGLHPASSRLARRFSWPTLVFNPHEQFAALRRQGQYGRFADVIRARELALQGSLNPNLAEWGTSSEARQYSGRAVGADWVCPFHPRQGQ